MDKFLEVLYDKFILRDVISKIIPGFLYFFFVGYILFGSDIVEFLNNNRLLIIILLGLSWIMAFVLQSLGEFLRLTKTRPHNIDKSTGDKRKIIFLEKSTPEEKTLYERFVVIKEATGNLGMSILAIYGTILITLPYTICGNISKLSFEKSLLIISIVIISLLIALLSLRMHRKFVKEQNDILNAVLNNKNVDIPS